MSCFHPGRMYQVVDRYTGEVQWVHSTDASAGFLLLKEVPRPCGQCVGCRYSKVMEWALRNSQESKMHKLSCFITLTYSSQNLPVGGTLVKKHFQDFMKRLREKFNDTKIREFHCGEYGEELQRPHYHALLFGFDFPDKILWKSSEVGNLYRSPILEKLWTFGFSSIGDVSPESCAYVSRYISKKITGKIAASHYRGRLPEYCDMSRRPGIGHSWFAQYKSDVFPSDDIRTRAGVVVKTPRYYDKLYDVVAPRMLERIKARRVLKAQEFLADQTPRRLKDREVVLRDKLKKKKRSFENGTAS